MASEGERRADDGSGPAVSALPEGVTEIDAAPAAGAVVCGRNQAAESRLEAKHAEKLARDPKHLRVLDFAAVREIGSVLAPGRDGRKGLLPLFNLLPQRIGEISVGAVKVAATQWFVFKWTMASVFGLFTGNVRRRTASIS
jgi:hypothetical protein